MLIIPADIITGTLVNAIALMGRKVSAAVAGLRGEDHDLTTARWFETFRLSGSVPDLPEVSLSSQDHLSEILDGGEIQAALQELLAARLTDAPEIDASRARNAVRLTLTIADPEATPFAEALVSYYDDKICGLVARLEGENPPLLAQIRGEAFSTRMINIMHAIERHTAALTSRPDYRTEDSFLTSYRHHVVDQHGKLEPPDFERRRRVPIADIYVPATITIDSIRGRSGRTRAPDQASSTLNVFTLADMIDRSVLLGDPGGGKTTAANVLMHHFAQQSTGCVPFLVTLRDFAAQYPPERSVVGHIEHTLETLYQCPSPPGLVDLLLLTARAVVIFDGLDELLDTSRRMDVATRVERFCAEYPLVPVIVTSRVVGYDQARLDDSQFSCYRLGGLSNEQVNEYVHKWFALDSDARPDDAEAFLTESCAIPDLLSTPLLLALLCILYRGAGSLPRNRAEVYEQCTTLLFRRWDARRHIHQDLRAGHLLEPALRHLAWWLFTQDDAQAVTARRLIVATTDFLHGRGFESKDEAREAACEFIEFCRGRMWVFSDTGTTPTGERLYQFTHRTFLEYFAAAQLAYDCDTPEMLADSLAPYVARNEWSVVGELAVQLKDRTSNGGARRIYATLLNDSSRQSSHPYINVLRFLAQCLRSVDPSPQTVRELTRMILVNAFSGHERIAFETLLSNCSVYAALVRDEIETLSTSMLNASNQEQLEDNVSFVLSLSAIILHFSRQGDFSDPTFENDYFGYLVEANPDEVIAVAWTNYYVRSYALYNGLITVDQALKMPGELNALFLATDSFFEGYGRIPPLEPFYERVTMGWPSFADAGSIAAFNAVGQYLCDHPELPWFRGKLEWFGDPPPTLDLEFETRSAATLGPIPWLGAAAILSIPTESDRTAILDLDVEKLGPLEKLSDYLRLRNLRSPRNRPSVLPSMELPELPVPDEFKQVFRDWANGQLDFTAEE